MSFTMGQCRTVDEWIKALKKLTAKQNKVSIKDIAITSYNNSPEIAKTLVTYEILSKKQSQITFFTDEEVEEAFKETFIEDFLEVDPSEEVTIPNGCLHKNKKKVKFNTFEYEYCTDCKKEIKDLDKSGACIIKIIV